MVLAHQPVAEKHTVFNQRHNALKNRMEMEHTTVTQIAIKRLVHLKMGNYYLNGKRE